MNSLYGFLEKLSKTEITNIISNLALIITLLITLYSLIKNNQYLKASNYLLINQHHREIWNNIYQKNSLKRVFDYNVQRPFKVSDEEFQFVNMIFLHMSGTYKLIKKRACYKVDGMDLDLMDIMSYPIPQKVWKEVSKFHDKDFIKYVNTTLKNK